MNIQIGRVMIIKPNINACNYTKKCIQEHGKKGFEILNFNPSSWRFGKTPAAHFKSLTHSRIDGEQKRKKWSGWISLLEIEEVNEKNHRV